MTNTLPRTGCFSRNASASKFRGGDDASARKRIAALTIGGPFSLLVTRRSDSRRFGEALIVPDLRRN